MLIDPRRELIIPGDANVTMAFCADHFLKMSQKAIADHGAFYVALSGGSTPKELFHRLSLPPFSESVDWAKVHLFWSDERTVPPDHPDSNYAMAMAAGLGKMPIPKNQIHRMQAESDLEQHAELYEKTIRDVLQGRPFDMIMLGMGDDGHTASLFPNTEGLKETKRLVIPNHVPQKNTWRMTMTFPLINSALCTVFYVIGANKKEMLSRVLKSGEELPSGRVGTNEHPAHWIADEAAAAALIAD